MSIRLPNAKDITFIYQELVMDHRIAIINCFDCNRFALSSLVADPME